MIIYLVDRQYPTRMIFEVDREECKIIRRKFTWVDFKGRRFLVGCTAFYTKSSAVRAKLGYLVQMTKSRYCSIYQPERWQLAVEQVALYKKKTIFMEPDDPRFKTQPFHFAPGIVTKSGHLSKRYRGYSNRWLD